MRRWATRPVARIGLRRAPVDANYGFGRGRPIDRYYIERFLCSHRDAIRGDVLEIEHDVYTRRFGGAKVRRCDILHVDPAFPRATVVADLAAGDDIASDRFDCLVVVQTLQYIYDVAAAVRTTHRILRPGGTVLVTVPALARLDQPDDAGGWGEYWRFTSMSARRLFGDVFGAANVSVSGHGNLATAGALLAGLAAEDLTADELHSRDPLFECLITLRAEKAA